MKFRLVVSLGWVVDLAFGATVVGLTGLAVWLALKGEVQQSLIAMLAGGVWQLAHVSTRRGNREEDQARALKALSDRRTAGRTT
jgi:hypothetical protein